VDYARTRRVAVQGFSSFAHRASSSPGLLASPPRALASPPDAPESLSSLLRRLAARQVASDAPELHGGLAALETRLIAQRAQEAVPARRRRDETTHVGQRLGRERIVIREHLEPVAPTGDATRESAPRHLRCSCRCTTRRRTARDAPAPARRCDELRRADARGQHASARLAERPQHCNVRSQDG